MNCILTLLTGFLLISGIHAQTSKVDSLLFLTNSLDDSVKFNAYLAFYLHYKDHNVDSANLFVDKAIKLAVDNNNTKQEIYFTNAKGHLFAHSGKLDNAVKYYEMALDKAITFGDTFSAIRSTGNIGAMYNEKGIFDKSSKWLFEALTMAENYGHPETEAMLLTNIGYLFLNQED